MITNSKNYKKLACVYKIECSVNGFVYIGQTINLFRRVAEHKYKLARGAHRNKQLQADYDKFGENCFSISIISSASPDDLDNIERSAIAYAQSTNKCYNVFGGGKSGYTVTEAFRKRASEINKGKVVSEATKLKMAESTKRQWENESYRALMQDSAKRQWTNSEYRNNMIDLHTGSANACGHKLTEADVIEAINEHSNGASTAKLAEKYGVTYCTMRNAIVGETWKSVPRK